MRDLSCCIHSYNSLGCEATADTPLRTRLLENTYASATAVPAIFSDGSKSHQSGRHSDAVMDYTRARLPSLLPHGTTSAATSAITMHY
jgi:hypothetical protein